MKHKKCTQRNINTRNSKFGLALVIETTPTSGSYVLGFRIDPESKLTVVKQQLESLFKVYSQNPMFGVNFEKQDKSLPISELKVKHKADIVEIIDDDDIDLLGRYYADIEGTNGNDGHQVNAHNKKPVFNKQLGLAVEYSPLMSDDPENFDISKLWNIVQK